MRIGDIVYFSPKHKVIDLNWNDKNSLIDSFRDRVEGYYINPAREMNDHKLGFAAGVLCVTTIDFLAWFQTNESDVGKRIEKWLKDNSDDFKAPDPENAKRSLAKRFHDEFRNGLVHEGRIKNGGQFSYAVEHVLKVIDSVMIVNPTKLVEVISTCLDNYLSKTACDEFCFQAFKCSLIRGFQKDVEIARR